jgi:hypothetical protein
MAEFFTDNAPDFGAEDGLMGPPGTSIADRFRRAALILARTTQNTWQDPAHTLFPWSGAVGGLVREIPAYVSDMRTRDPNARSNSYFSEPNPRQPTADTTLAGRYVGPNDMLAHNLVPGYIPRQELQNLVKQDPLADLLGPMQKPAAKQPLPTSGF